MSEKTNKLKIGWIGLGKLGLVCALASENKGNEVVGYDPSPQVDEILRTRKLPYREAGAQELLEKTNIKNVSVEEVVAFSDLVFIAVQTPHQELYEGKTRVPDTRVDFDYTYLIQACKQVNAAAEKLGKTTHLVIISTVMPGTVDREIRPLLGPRIKLGYSPLFIAMGTCRSDYENPEFILFGIDDEETYELALRFFSTIHNKRVFKTTIKNAEMIKVSYNTAITAKIELANTIMEVCHKIGADCDVVMDALCLGTDRIISPKYMRGGMGDSGGCMLPTGLVYTEHGLSEIQDLEPGDKVLSSDGKLHTVIETYKRPYKGPMLRIKARGLPREIVTLNHPFLAGRDLRKVQIIDGKEKRVNQVGQGVKDIIGPLEEVKAEFLTRDHYLVFPKPIENSVQAPVYASDEYVTLAGYYLSEGSLDKKKTQKNYGRISFSFHKKEQEYLSEVQKLIETLYPGAYTARQIKEGSLGEDLRYNNVELAMRLFEDFGKGSSEKFIPNWILYGDIKHARNLLRGLFRGDGSSHEEGISYSTTSRELAHGVSLLLRRFGIISTFNYHKPRVGINDGVQHRESWDIEVSNAVYIPKLADLVSMPIKHKMQEKLYPNVIPLEEETGYSYHKIEEIDVVEYEGTVWNMNVSDTHQYVTSLGINFNCHPRDLIALSWLSREIGLSCEWYDKLIDVREKQTEFLADLIEAHGKVNVLSPENFEVTHQKLLPVVILGTAYKKETNLEIGSSAILLQNILKERGIESEDYDPWVDPNEDKFVNPYEKGPSKLFFIGMNHDEFKSYKFPPGSVVLDPWRMIPDQKYVRVIRIGEGKK